MNYDDEVSDVNNLEEIFESLISVYENPPEGIDIENIDEGDVKEGALDYEPKEVKLLLEIEEEDIPKSKTVHMTFTPWYANDSFIQRTHGHGCDIGVDITVELLN